MKRRDAESNQYLTKRILVRAARLGVRQAAAETMAVMGFNVVAHDGWVVKRFQDGRIERITPIKPAENNEVILD